MIEDEKARIGSRLIHDGRVVHLSMDTVRFPDGSEGELELIRHPGASAVLPVKGSLEDSDPEVLLIRQYRYAAGGYIYEVPAGLPEEGETWEQCAHRELEEEAGVRAGRLVPMTSILTTPGFTNEVIHLFAAFDLEEGRVRHDDDEFLDVVAMPMSAVMELIRDGKIRDGKSLCTLFYAQSFLIGSGA